MALPIAPTPPLDVKTSRKFLEKVEREKDIPFGLVPTPGIDEAIEQVIADMREKMRKWRENKSQPELIVSPLYDDVYWEGMEGFTK